MVKFLKTDSHSVSELVSLIGGKDNIAMVTHCMTRLRFTLTNVMDADVESVKCLSFVKGCFTNSGQFQVIIGPNVQNYYQALTEHLNINPAAEKRAYSAVQDNQSLWERVISYLAEIFIPLLPALISGGLLLGLRNLIGDMAIIDNKTLTETYPQLAPFYDILWLPCEAIFHFLPVAVCWSTVKKMGGSEVLGIILGIALVSPQLINAYNIGNQVASVWDFHLFKIEKIGYQAQVIPAIFSGITLGWIEGKLRKIIPDSLNLVIVPVAALLLSVLLAHIVLGPIGRSLGNGIADIVKFLMTGNFAPIGSAVFGFFYAPLVVTGVHHATLAIDLQMTSSMGGTPVWPIIALSNIAQASAVVGMVLVSKKANERKISIPAAISGYFGVTEPAMYGINLPYKFPMLCAMIGSAIAGLICGWFSVLSNGIGVGGLPSILSIKPVHWVTYLIAVLMTIIIPIVLTILVYKFKQRRGTIPKI